MTTIGTEGSGAHPRFADALRELGLDHLHGQIRRFPDATRTAAEAAAAIGCELSQICKSLIFAAWGSPCSSKAESLGERCPCWCSWMAPPAWMWSG